MAHVLIGFAEALPAPEVVFSLIAAGHQVSAFSRKEVSPLRNLPLVAVHKVPAAEDSVIECAKALKALMTGLDAPDLLLPMDDVALWVSQRLELGARLVGASGAQADAALNKAIQVIAAQEAGLSMPTTLSLSEFKNNLDQVAYPVIAKPTNAVHEQNGRLGKEDVAYLETREAAEAFLSTLPDGIGPYFIQPLIHGRGAGVFGFATAQGVVAWSGHERVRMMNPHGSGASACAAFFPADELKAKIARFVQTIGWRGPFMVELLRDSSGAYWFMELNGRMWGSMALARRQGFEYPAWAVALAQSSDFVPNENTVKPQQGLVMRHLGREILHLLFVLRGPKSDFHKANWPSFPRQLMDVMRPARRSTRYNYDPSCPTFYLGDAFRTVKGALKR